MLSIKCKSFATVAKNQQLAFYPAIQRTGVFAEQQEPLYLLNLCGFILRVLYAWECRGLQFAACDLPQEFCHIATRVTAQPPDDRGGAGADDCAMLYIDFIYVCTCLTSLELH